MGIFQKLFGTHSERELKLIYPIVDKIEATQSFARKRRSLSSVLQKVRPLTTFCRRPLLLCVRRRDVLSEWSITVYS